MAEAFRYIQRLALTFWLGEMLFFAAIFAPRVFRVLPREWASRLQNEIFPAYFTSGIVCAVVIIAAALYLRPARQLPILILAGFSAIIFVYSRYSITPQLIQLREAVLADPNMPAFTALHKLSVRLNVAALLALLALLKFI